MSDPMRITALAAALACCTLLPATVLGQEYPARPVHLVVPYGPGGSDLQLRIAAPFTGRVGMRQVSAGALVTVGVAITTLDDIAKVKMDFTLPELMVGSTANQNGTALFEGVTVLFLAQVYGLDLSVSQQVRVMLMSIVAGN